jgi:hypothetical protein
MIPKAQNCGHSRRLWLSRNGHSQKVLDDSLGVPESRKVIYLMTTQARYALVWQDARSNPSHA